MARQITVLETNPADGGQISVRCAFWFPVTAGKEVPKPTYTSVITGAAIPTGAEDSALKAGQVLEEVKAFTFPDNMSAATIKSTLVTFYARRAAYLATLPFQGQYYGVIYDGTSWSA
jgi:hypothetical protein